MTAIAITIKSSGGGSVKDVSEFINFIKEINGEVTVISDASLSIMKFDK